LPNDITLHFCGILPSLYPCLVLIDKLFEDASSYSLDFRLFAFPDRLLPFDKTVFGILELVSAGRLPDDPPVQPA
jgi:hypothetical protein